LCFCPTSPLPQSNFGPRATRVPGAFRRSRAPPEVPIQKIVNKLSPPIRIAALVGLLAAVAMGAGFMLLGRSTAVSEASIAPVLRPKNTAPPKAQPPQPKARPKPAVLTAAEVRTKAALEAGLPRPVARALGAHEVVVVSLNREDAGLDEISRAEAELGAKKAGAGFVVVDVANERDATALTQLVGILSTPGTLIYRRPSELAMRLDGFQDNETVAQAAVNVTPAEVAKPAASTPWATKANAICARMNAKAVEVGNAQTDQQVLTKGPKLVAIQRSAIAELRALPAPRGHEKQVAQLLALYATSSNASADAIAATRRGDAKAVQAATATGVPATARANALAADLGATECARDPFASA
jgi:hypothetical protein